MNDVQITPPNDSLGYYFYPPEYAFDPGHPQMVITLRPVPTGKHFDPESVQYPVVSATQDLESLILEHPWPRSEHYQVPAGRIILTDRISKVVEAFTFGGKLQIIAAGDYTKSTLKSPAPILGPLVEDTVASVLAQEVEILLAERRSALASKPGDYDRRLATAHPIDLYLACLDQLHKKFERLPFIENGLNQKFSHFLNVESQSRKARYPNSQPLKLSDLV